MVVEGGEGVRVRIWKRIIWKDRSCDASFDRSLYAHHFGKSIFNLCTVLSSVLCSGTKRKEFETLKILKFGEI